jgi:hypothetical protein
MRTVLQEEAALEEHPVVDEVEEGKCQQPHGWVEHRPLRSGFVLDAAESYLDALVVRTGYNAL